MDPAAHAAREAHQRHEGLPGGLVTPEDATEAFLLRETEPEDRPWYLNIPMDLQLP